jgi:RimJ/RimL family protein N-acetyltransferase/isopentenyldiphosphate isomerase
MAIQGVTTNLRAIEHEDALLLYRWLNEPAVMAGWGQSVAAVSQAVVSRQVAGWIEREAEIGRPVGFVGETLDARPVGLIVAMPEDRERRAVRLSLLIGDPGEWGQGYAGDALDTFLEAAFDGWNLHRIWLEVEDGNERALRLYRSAGFSDEGTLREARFRNGERRDVHLMGITAPEWRERQKSPWPPSRAQDPDEPFDVVTPLGEPTGRSKPRWQVHRDGDWHRSIHLWMCGIEAGVSFLDVQRRGLEKDTWPGQLDATVAGHLRAGEDLKAALREVEEEVGLTLTMRDVVHAGTHISVSDIPGSRLDREFQEVLLARIDQPLTAYQPNPDEVDGIVRIRLDDALALLAGEQGSAAATIISAGAADVEPIEVTANDFIPSVDRYTLRVAVASRRFLAGEHPIVV